MDFSRKLKKERNKRKLTQDAVAEKINIKRSTYAKYETGENEPSYETLKIIAEFFGVSTDYLLGVDQENAFNPLKELNDYIKQIGIESIGFFNIKDWENLKLEDIEDIKKHFDWIAQKAKNREKHKTLD